ncbi:potassium transporter TrkG [uncultured Desulfuromonas sp.]|uniref:TrkH family potassium uptake protein n=1 Tax=uncultured Desulfuromonas sp. TaxID=181013 RepID=UPI002AAA7809|nr:potassium transporter TrkG [uncultured Desulfuromonas sp.]
MSQPGSELFFAVRPKLIGHYFGQFCLIMAALNLVTLVVSLLTAPDWRISLSYALIILGLLLAWLVLKRLRVSQRMQMNEAMVLAALVFLVVPFIMTIPLLVSDIPFMDALFETVSAVTTTGLSTLPGMEGKPLIFTFSRAWMQWYGGLGIVVFSLALVVRPGLSALRLAAMDEPDDLVGGTRAHARRVVIVYGVLTLSGILLWLVLGGSLRDGVLYILSAVSTGGFAPTSGSFADLPHVRLAWVVTLVTLAGSLPLALYHQTWRNGLRPLLDNVEIRLLATLLLVFTALVTVSMWSDGTPWSTALHHASLMVCSAQTTAGFSSLDPATLDPGSKLLLILSMLVGGGVGSTAGGFKLLRLLVLLTLIRHFVRTMSVPPNTVLRQKIGKKILEQDDVQDALMIILLFIGAVLLSWLPFVAYGYDPLNALFDVVSATATVGLSTGIIGAELPNPLKGILCVDMFLGRLECVAWLIFFYHRTWFGRKREN